MQRLRAWFSRRNAWSRRLLLLVLGLSVAGLVLWFTPTHWYITAPGAAIDTSRLVSVPGGHAHRGQLYMLVVTVQPANLFWYLYAKMDARAELETPEKFLGPVEDYDQYLELTRQMMADSVQAAKAVALQQSGYGTGAYPAGVLVTGLSKESPSKGVLNAGDVITALNSQPVKTPEELRAIVRAVKPGAPITVGFTRRDQSLSASVTTRENPDVPGAAMLGILVDQKYGFDVPVPVQIKPGLITGPSAGLMFTLQIIDQLTPGGIAGNKVIAGTGTIEADGSVGAIGGVQQKVYAAEAAGAVVFFSPRDNYEDARKAATRVEVVPVDHVQDALKWLKAHAEGGA